MSSGDYINAVEREQDECTKMRRVQPLLITALRKVVAAYDKIPEYHMTPEMFDLLSTARSAIKAAKEPR